jgi:CubicO group peptidase (beta-lactamase class C family)
MTKPITAVVTLLLVDQGVIKLEDPIEKWLPELTGRRVLKRIDGPIGETVAANRRITVEDLLSFRMGFGLIMDFSRKYPISDKFEEKELLGLGAPDLSSTLSHEEWLKRFAELPLMIQPGDQWQYNTAFYLLSVFLSRVTGKPLDQLFAESIFQPLGMKDTGFTVPKEKTERFSDCYWFDSENKKLELYDAADDSLWSKKPAFLDGAAGLVSTAPEYLMFSKMLLSGGKHDGKTFLSPEMHAAMTRNQLTPEQLSKPTFSPDQWKNHGYGYGVSVVTSESKKINGKLGQYGWDGGFGSSWRVDPKANLIGVILTERTFDTPALPPICEAFWDEVYGRS